MAIQKIPIMTEYEACFWHARVGTLMAASRFMRINCAKCGNFQVVPVCSNCAGIIDNYKKGQNTHCLKCNELVDAKETYKTIGDV